jgi:hypothetical protein
MRLTVVELSAVVVRRPLDGLRKTASSESVGLSGPGGRLLRLTPTVTGFVQVGLAVSWADSKAGASAFGQLRG